MASADDGTAQTGRSGRSPPGSRGRGGAGEVSLTEVADEPFIVLRHRYGLRSIIEDLFREAGIRPRIAFEGEETRTLRGLVAAGLGVAVVPPGDAVAGVAEREIAGARRMIGLVWVADRTRPPAVENFRRFVLAHAAEYEVDPDEVAYSTVASRRSPEP